MSRKPGVTEYPCGCSHDVHAWLALCAKHEAEWNETHTRWAGEKAGLIVALAATVATLTGCGALPDRAGIYATHTSVPFAGQGPAPIGDQDRRSESNYEALRASLIWERDGWTVASDVDAVLHSNNVDAPTGVLWSIRIGKEVNLTW